MVSHTPKSNPPAPLEQVPSYLSEVTPAEHAFILLERTRWAWVQRVALLYATSVL